MSLLRSMRRAIRRVQGTGFVQFRLPRAGAPARLTVVLFGVAYPAFVAYALISWIVELKTVYDPRGGTYFFIAVPLAIIGFVCYFWLSPRALFGWRVRVTSDSLRWRNAVRWEHVARERIVGVAGATVPMFRGMFVVDQGSYLVVGVRDDRTNAADQAAVTVLPIPASETWSRWHRLHVWAIGHWLSRDRDRREVLRLNRVVADCIRERYGDKPPKRFIPFQVPAAGSTRWMLRTPGDGLDLQRPRAATVENPQRRR